MLKYAKNIKQYAQKICQASDYCRSVKNTRNSMMKDICTYMQNMQSRILYPVYADICISPFADASSLSESA
jgi:hypothetical protein